MDPPRLLEVGDPPVRPSCERVLYRGEDSTGRGDCSELARIKTGVAFDEVVRWD